MTHPRVFLSYSHDSPEHALRIRNLSDRLRRDGVDCMIDQYEPAPPEGWPRWMERQIEEAEYVLVACTETYRRRAAGKERPGVGHGVIFESVLLVQELYEAAMHNERFLPILFDEAGAAHIPKPLRGFTFYRVDQEEGYEDLLRRLTGQPRIAKPDMGTALSLPPENTAVDVPAPASPGPRRARTGAVTVIRALLVLALAAMVTASLLGRAPARLVVSDVLLPEAQPRTAAEEKYAEGLEEMAHFEILAAQEAFEAAVRLDSQLALAHSALAAVWLQRGDIEKAGREADKALIFSRRRRLPRDQRLFVEAAYYRVIGKWGDAISRLSELHRQHPEDLEIALGLADAQTEAGQETAALATLGRIRRALPAGRGIDPRIDLAEACAAGPLGDFPRMQASARRAVDNARRLGLRRAVAQGLVYRGIAEDFQGQPDAALRDYEEARGIYISLGDPLGTAETLNAIAMIHWSKGELRAARAGFEEARRTYAGLGAAAAADQLDSLAAIAAVGDDLAAAHRLFQEAIEAHRQDEDPESQAGALAAFALLLLDELKLPQAGAALADAGKLTESAGTVAQIREAEGRLLHLQGHSKEAREKLQRALRFWIEAQVPERTVRIHLTLAALSLDDGLASQAEFSAREAVKNSTGKWPDLAAEGEALLARALLAQGRTADAQAALARARRRAGRTESFRLRLLVGLTDARLRLANDPTTALEQLRTLRERAARAGYAALELEARKMEE